MSSCYTTYSVYKGNVHQQAIGQSKNEILRSYGVPENIMDDGAGGIILVYEKYTQTTTTNSATGSYGSSSTTGGGIYGNGRVVGEQQTKVGAVSSSNEISQTSTSKTYCYLFLDSNNIVYDYKTNYGSLYDYNQCFNKKETWWWVRYSCLFIFPAVITIPWAIVEQKKAKKKGIICK